MIEAGNKPLTRNNRTVPKPSGFGKPKRTGRSSAFDSIMNYQFESPIDSEELL